MTREDGTAMRVDRRQHKLGQVARYTPAHSTRTPNVLNINIVDAYFLTQY